MDSPPQTTRTLDWMKVVKSDLVVQMAVIFPLVFLGFIIVLNVFGGLPGFGRRGAIEQGSGTTFFAYALGVALLIGIPLIWWRIRGVQEVVANGMEVTGTVTGISFNKDRGRVKWNYQVAAEKFEGACLITKNDFTRSLKVGDQVVLIVNREQPKRSILANIYT